MSLLLYGKVWCTAWQQASSYLQNNEPILIQSPLSLPRQQCRALTMSKVRRWITLVNTKALEPDVETAAYSLLVGFDDSFNMRLGVQFFLFETTLMVHTHPQHNPTIFKTILPKIRTMEVIGCYAMTEMGNGSNLRFLETTATYHKPTQEFIVNTPTLTSTKWWMGLAAETATHAVVFARLLLPHYAASDVAVYRTFGLHSPDTTHHYVDCGIHIFVVPLRDATSHTPLPGVEIGDLGDKIGRQGVDNGWIRLTNVRIPREYMLMRFAHLTPQGEYTKIGQPQLAYSALIGGRVRLVRASVTQAMKVLTITIRYACVRRIHQSRLTPAPSLLSFKVQQYKLLPHLATCYALHFVANHLHNVYQTLLHKITTSSDIADSKSLYRHLVDLHSVVACLKAFSTEWSLSLIEKCRTTLGGHGYAVYSGVGPAYNEFAMAVTGEGDNTVLYLQTARYLLGMFKLTLSNSPVADSVQYLVGVDSSFRKQKWNVSSLQELLSTDCTVLLTGWRYLGVMGVAKAARTLQSEAQHGTFSDAWDRTSVLLVETAKIHALVYTVTIFHSFLTQIRGSAPTPLYTVLLRLFQLFALYHMQSYVANLLECSFITPLQTELIRQSLDSLCSYLRPDAIALVDAFLLPDWMLNSSLGVYNGNVYQCTFDRVNAQKQLSHTPPYWDEETKPLTNPKATHRHQI